MLDLARKICAVLAILIVQAPANANAVIPIWTDLGSPPVRVMDERLTPLGEGRILLTGGSLIRGGESDQAWVFDSATSGWTQLPNMPSPRTRHLVVALPDGSVLLAGGSSMNKGLATASLLTSDHSHWQSLPNALDLTIDASATLLNDGRVLITGGYSGTGVTNATELFDPAKRSWSAATPMPGSRSGHSSLVLRDGSVLIAGGGSAIGPAVDIYLYRLSTDTWTTLAPIPKVAFGAALVALRDGRVLVAGGRVPIVNGDGNPSVAGVTSTFILNLSTNIWTPAAPMPIGGVGPALIMSDGRVLMALPAVGFNVTPEIYDPVANTWISLPARVLHNPQMALSSQDRVLIVGQGDTYLVDPAGQRLAPSPETIVKQVTAAAASTSTTTTLVNLMIIMIVLGIIAWMTRYIVISRRNAKSP